MRVTKGKLRMTTFKEIHEELTVIFSYLISSYREKLTLLGDAQGKDKRQWTQIATREMAIR